VSKTVISESILNYIINDYYSVRMINIERDIISNINKVIDIIETEIFIGFYYMNDVTPFLLKGEEFNLYNKIYIINNSNDLKRYIEDGGKIIINDNINITKVNIKILKYIYDKPTYSVIISLMLTYLESFFMLNIHIESDIVIKDSLNISNETSLVNVSSLLYNNINEYLTENLIIANYSLDLEKIFISLKQQVLDNINYETDKSIMFNIKNNVIIITEYAPPSAIRYLLNSRIRS